MSEQEVYVFVCDSASVENGSEAVFEVNDREVNKRDANLENTHWQ